MIKLIPYLKKEIKSKLEKYKRLKISLRYPIQKIIDDLNMYRIHILSDIIPLESSYVCKNHFRKLSFELGKNSIVFERPYCSECEIKLLEYFKDNYNSELILFHNNNEQLTKLFRKNEKKKYQNALKFLLEITKESKIDGRKRFCWNLIDIFLVLETPMDYIILTTNLRHQEPFANISNKKIMGID